VTTYIPAKAPEERLLDCEAFSPVVPPGEGNDDFVEGATPVVAAVAGGAVVVCPGMLICFQGWLKDVQTNS